MQTETAHLIPSPLTPARPAETLPCVFDWDDFRAFLKAWFQARKSAHTGYSGAVFARKAGLSSHTLLGMVIRGDRNLSHSTIRAFARALELNAREALYFEKLVLFNQAENSEDREFYLDQLLSISRGNGQKLLTRLRNHGEYLSHWYVVAIRELVQLGDFNPDPAWISQKLKKRISRKEAETAVNLLLELGMLTKDPETGKLSPSDPEIDFDPGIASAAIRNYHKQYLRLAEHSTDHEPLSERELSSLTLCVTPEQLEVLRGRIKEFRKQINIEFSDISSTRGAPPSVLVALNSQLLVLTE